MGERRVGTYDFPKGRKGAQKGHKGVAFGFCGWESRANDLAVLTHRHPGWQKIARRRRQDPKTLKPLK